VVINGTCLDFLAESFMAGDPWPGRIRDPQRRGVRHQRPPDAASLAVSGQQPVLAGQRRAIYLRDPGRSVVERQLNGGVFSPLGDKDWRLIRGYLEENERLFASRWRSCCG